MKRVAIIGTGISGLTAAYYLKDAFSIKLFEAGNRIGGHTNTVPVSLNEGDFDVDTGFIVFNNRTYPNFIRLMRELGVPYQDSSMSFSVKNATSGLEYRGADLNGFFAQRSNLIRPRIYRILAGLLRFNRIAQEFLHSSQADSMSIREFFARYRFSSLFIENYFLPMGSAIWSCPHEKFLDFPIRFVMEFYRNHGLLSVNDRPQWHVIRGGSKQYLEPLTRDFTDRISVDSPVEKIVRSEAQVDLFLKGARESFDHVVFACHADQALSILGDQARPIEREFLAAFPYERNCVTLHTDGRLMPRQKRAWACWNYQIDPARANHATVTYFMNALQGLDVETPLLVSLNSADQIDPRQVIQEIEYHHPVFQLRRDEYQNRHSELIDLQGCSFCGAYWGNGFHEDGVVSAIRVARSLMSHSGSPSSLEFAQ